MEPGDIPAWVIGSDFNRPDPMTPMFDDLFGFFVTREPTAPQKFADADGSVYVRANPDEFEAAS